MATYNPASGKLKIGAWKEQLPLIAVGATVFLLANFWLRQVTKYVTDPYLDEVFHVPQAQVYCSGNFRKWDDKITTPPGLYAFSYMILGLGRTCSTHDLRLTNVTALFILFIIAATCRNITESIPSNIPSKTTIKSWSFQLKPKSSYALHTALNIALFPPLFFFSALYYTDILSTGMVILTYCVFLRRKGAYNNSASGGLLIFIYGILALTMRQTNIFWVAVFMAGLEVVRTVKSLGPFPARTWKGDMHPYKYVQYQVETYARGELHDVALGNATLYDCALCAISVAIAAICNPVVIITRLWPYLALLCSFATFVLWNGGVVLGDKSNHVATIHLPQMLYIWPFFVFFSAPLLYPLVINLLKSFYNQVIGSGATRNTSVTNPQGTRNRQLEISYHSYTISIISFSTLLTTMLAIIHYNTIIHPFTLADNRHYVFYVFRYSIRAHPLIKYLLSPIYLFCSWLVFRALSGYSFQNTSSATSNSQKMPKTEEEQKSAAKDPTVTKTSGNAPAQADGNTTSFALIWFISTALSLITAPLVEPRYFIIPWVIWRLHVPATTSAKHDHRLWLETIWFLAINGVTGYVFLFRGFEWPQEPGKVQRFMW